MTIHRLVAVSIASLIAVEVWGWRGLVTHYLLFVIDLTTRLVDIAGITTNPNEDGGRRPIHGGFALRVIGRGLAVGRSGAARQ